MQKILVQIYGVLIAILALGGLFVTEGYYLLGFMNADTALDVTRVVLAVALIAIGFFSRSALLIRGSLAFVGILYVGVGVLGLFDATIWGLLPTGLTGFDIAFHLVTGVIAAGAAFFPNKDEVTVRR